MKSQLFLNTRYSEEDNNYDTSFYINNPRLNLLRGFKIRPCAAYFINAVYPINRFNNNIYFLENKDAVDSSIVTISFPYGNYTGTQVASELTSLMSANSPNGYTYTFDYNTEDKIISVTTDITGGDYFQWALGDNHFYEELGFNLNTFDFPYQEYVGAYPVNFSGTHLIQVWTNLASMNYTAGFGNQAICEIPIDVPFGSMVTWQGMDLEPLFVSVDALQELRIQLRDYKGNFYELPDNHHFTIRFEIQEIPNS